MIITINNKTKLLRLKNKTNNKKKSTASIQEESWVQYFEGNTVSNHSN